MAVNEGAVLIRGFCTTLLTLGPYKPGQYNNGSQLVECAVGSYSPGGLVSQCTQCAVNQYQSSKGQSSNIIFVDIRYICQISPSSSSSEPLCPRSGIL